MSKEKATPPDRTKRRPESQGSKLKGKPRARDKKATRRADKAAAERPSKQIVISRSSAIIWGLILCVFMIWIFSLGILVGRGYFPQHEKLKMLEERMNRLGLDQPPKVTVEESPPSPSPGPPALTFYKSLTGEKELADSGLKQKPKPASIPAEPQNKAADHPVVSAESGPAEKVSEALLPGRNHEGEFTIQVAAVSDPDQARRLVNFLRQKGYPAYFYHVRQNSRRFFRIRVGYYGTRAEAETVMTELKKIGRRDMFISRLEN